MTAMDQEDAQILLDKLAATLDNDCMAFHIAAEREIFRKDEEREKEERMNTAIANGVSRLRQQNEANMRRIEELEREVEALKQENEMLLCGDSGIAHMLPYSEVKTFLSYIDFYPDSLLDEDIKAEVEEWGWRNLLQKYVDTHGSLPQPS
jgi:formiminotetrahydrofolate cyclodeaminase